MLLATHCPSRIHQTETSRPTVQFLDLPPEIRSQIASYLIVSSSPITIHEPRFNRRSPRPLGKTLPRTTGPHPGPAPATPPPEDIVTAGRTCLALLLTCRLLYRENWKIYYGLNEFYFHHSTLSPFISSIPRRCSNQIRRLSFRLPYKHRHERTWQMLALLKKLEELELWLHPPHSARHSEWESCAEGVKHCPRLKVLRIRRDKGAGGTMEQRVLEQRVLERDRGVEEGVNAFLRQRFMERGRDFAGNRCIAMLELLESPGG